MKINTVDDVRGFFKHLINVEHLSLHPDDDFSRYVDTNGEPVYTTQQAYELNELMERCFDICDAAGADVYSIALELTL